MTVVVCIKRCFRHLGTMEPTAKHVISFKAFYGEPVSKQYKGKYRNEFVEMQKKE